MQTKYLVNFQDREFIKSNTLNIATAKSQEGTNAQVPVGSRGALLDCDDVIALEDGNAIFTNIRVQLPPIDVSSVDIPQTTLDGVVLEFDEATAVETDSGSMEFSLYFSLNPQPSDFQTGKTAGTDTLPPTEYVNRQPFPEGYPRIELDPAGDIEVKIADIDYSMFFVPGIAPLRYVDFNLPKKNQSVALKNELEEIKKLLQPAGTIITFAGTTAPDGYLFCDGSEISRNEYYELFDAIGTTWGAGDGSTTFNLPDIRSDFLRSAEDGSRVGESESWAIENITGSIEAAGLANNTGGAYQSSGSLGITPDETYRDSSRGSGNNNVSISIDASRQVQTANETRPRNKRILRCIKY